MSKLIRLLGSQSIALLTLCIVLSGGTAFAVGKTVAKNTVVSKSIKNGQVKTKDVALGSITGAQVADDGLGSADVAGLTGADVTDGSLNGADVADGSLRGTDVADDSLTNQDVDESTLTTVPSARVATLGGIARGGDRQSCDPTSVAYVTCVSVDIALPEAATLMLVGDATILNQTSSAASAQGFCRFTIDGTVQPEAVWVSKAGDVLRGSASLTRLYPAAAGMHTVVLQCNDQGSSATYVDAALTAVGFTDQ